MNKYFYFFFFCSPGTLFLIRLVSSTMHARLRTNTSVPKSSTDGKDASRYLYINHQGFRNTVCPYLKWVLCIPKFQTHQVYGFFFLQKIHVLKQLCIFNIKYSIMYSKEIFISLIVIFRTTQCTQYTFN